MSTQPVPFTGFVSNNNSSQPGNSKNSTASAKPFPFQPPVFTIAPSEKKESKEEVILETPPSTLIAIENQAKIMSTYELPGPPDVYKEEIHEQIAKYQEGCRKAILQLKEEKRLLKKEWEDKKENKVTTKDPNLHRWLFDEYANALPKCKVRLADVHPLINQQSAAMREGLKSQNLLIREVLTAEAYTIKIGPKNQPGFEVFTAYLAPHGFIKDEATSDTTERPVFQKLTGGFGSDLKAPEKNQYVLDDRGIVTPRFVFAFKSSEACEHLSKGNDLRGRYADGGKKDVFEVNDYVNGKIPELKVGKRMKEEEYLFVCQEYGSSKKEQRGVSLAATEKKIPSNEGTLFENSDSIKLKIDLAKMPLGQHNVFNLYSPEAQQRHTKGFRNWNGKLKRYFTAEQAKQHTDASTRKNREVICRKVPWDAVANKDEVRQSLGSSKKQKI